MAGQHTCLIMAEQGGHREDWDVGEEGHASRARS